MESDPSTRAVHAGEPRGSGAPSTPPIHLASVLESAGATDELPFVYGRHGNETWSALERVLGDLERAQSLVFASGLAACFAALMALTEDRSRVLVPSDGYFGFRDLAQRLARRGVEASTYDAADLGALEPELARGRALLWAESPTNPLMRVHDLRRLAELATRYGASMVVDNTAATAALQQPLDLGATASVTSLTKASSGHSDILLGAVATRDEALHAKLRTWRATAGAIPGPFECWIALRGLRTLPLRAARQSESALAIAQWLQRHPRVRAVHYPSLDPATRALAAAQMPRGCGALLSFELDGDADDANAVVAAARLVRPATSFGGVESSWERRARWRGEIAPGSLIRLSVGLEEPRDLLADLETALRATSRGPAA